VDYTVGASLLSGYLLALSRMAGFVLVAPPFNTRGIPSQARAAAAIAIAVPLSTWTIPKAPALNDGALISGMLVQLVSGAVLGMLVMLAVAAIQTVGDLIDVAGGFSITAGLDPLGLNQSSVMGRLHQLIALTLLFIGNGHIIVLAGLSRSFQLMPEPTMTWEQVARSLSSGLASMFLSALQITAPILGALLIADIGLGLLTRSAPALNAFSIAFPLKISLSLMLIGLILSQIPGALNHLIQQAGIGIIQLSGG
jgi:flagellar biosynthetic protein FliR